MVVRRVAAVGTVHLWVSCCVLQQIHNQTVSLIYAALLCFAAALLYDCVCKVYTAARIYTCVDQLTIRARQALTGQASTGDC